MTNKEAIIWLCGIREQFTGNCNTDTLVPVSRCDIQAIDLAIKALKMADCPQLQAECKACGGAFCDGEEETT